MDFGAFLTSLLELLAGVGIFIIGMNFMSEGLEKGRFTPLSFVLPKYTHFLLIYCV
ncbi:MAG: hypothetical protein IJ944_03280 [Clostridia bacterium]|nr:hypothetical protein [Clostridia bacterium]